MEIGLCGSAYSIDGSSSAHYLHISLLQIGANKIFPSFFPLSTFIFQPSWILNWTKCAPVIETPATVVHPASGFCYLEEISAFSPCSRTADQTRLCIAKKGFLEWALAQWKKKKADSFAIAISSRACSTWKQLMKEGLNNYSFERNWEAACFFKMAVNAASSCLHATKHTHTYPDRTFHNFTKNTNISNSLE